MASARRASSSSSRSPTPALPAAVEPERLGRLAIALELQDLDPEALGEGRGPGNVGAAVEVVADPAREGDEARAELGPALRVELSRDLEDQLVNLAQRRVQVDQGAQRLTVLLGEVERAVGTMLALADRAQLRLAVRRIARLRQRQLAQEDAELLGEREGRVRGDDDAEALALDALAEGLEGDAPAAAIPGEALDQLPDRGPVGVPAALAEIAPEAAGPAQEGQRGEALDQLLDRGERQLAGIEAAAEVERQQLDRVAVRVELGLAAARRDFGAQLGEQGLRIDLLGGMEAGEALRQERQLAAVRERVMPHRLDLGRHPRRPGSTGSWLVLGDPRAHMKANLALQHSTPGARLPERHHS